MRARRWYFAERESGCSFTWCVDNAFHSRSSEYTFASDLSTPSDQPLKRASVPSRRGIFGGSGGPFCRGSEALDSRLLAVERRIGAAAAMRAVSARHQLLTAPLACRMHAEPTTSSSEPMSLIHAFVPGPQPHTTTGRNNNKSLPL